MTVAMEEFDIIVIGSGPAGSSAVETARESGAERIALIEADERLGGECPNRGCVPTKALLRSAEVLGLMRRAEEFGLEKVEPSAIYAKVVSRERRIVDSLTGGDRLPDYFASLGATLLRGTARFVGEDVVQVGDRKFRSDRFVVATGSRPFVPPVDGLEEAGFVTSDGLVFEDTLPSSLAIIGGGPIGVEFAQVFSMFGVKVTIIEFAPHILPREDEEISEVVEASFRGRGMGIMTSSKAGSVRLDGDERIIQVVPANGKGDAVEVRAEKLLVAAGKRPALEGLGLDAAGITTNERGAPILDETLCSSNPRVWFAGDAAGQMLFTHVAHEQGVVAAVNAVKNEGRAADLTVVPRGTFCVPEVGSVGMTERQAKEKGIETGVGRFLFAHLGKSKVTGETEGLVKLVVDMKSKEVVGGHVAGHAAAELVHEIALAMYAGVPYTEIGKMIHAYPTYAEAVGAAAYDVK